MRLKNLEVAVEVADGPLKEYSVSQESDSVVNCYVPSSKGQVRTSQHLGRTYGLIYAFRPLSLS